jgi:DNA-binding MarR family transcriptional regulator
MSTDVQGVANRLHSGALHLVRAVSEVDTAMGLSAPRASLMSVLVFGGPRTIGELARIERVRSPTITALVNGLEAEGFVRRRAVAHDARQVVVEATAKGRRVLEAGRTRRVEFLSTLMAGATDAELAVLDRAATLMERLVAEARAR